jgi:hypothetical protein
VQLPSPLAVSVPLTAVKPSAPTGLDFAAGCLAGTVSVLVCHPIDTIRIQVQNGQFSKISECYQSYLRNGGRLGLFKGLFPPLMGASLQNAGVFGMKAVTQVFLKDTNDKSGQDSVFTSDKMISSAAAGLAGGVIASPIELLKISIAGMSSYANTYPIDVVKTKIQAEPSLKWKDRVSCAQMFRRLLKESGRSVFMRGFGATMLRAVPANMLIFGVYELTLELAGFGNFNRTTSSSSSSSSS